MVTMVTLACCLAVRPSNHCVRKKPRNDRACMLGYKMREHLFMNPAWFDHGDNVGEFANQCTEKENATFVTFVATFLYIQQY